MAPRLTSDFFVSAYLRRCGSAGAFAGLRRRGHVEAGAIFIIIDRLDGNATLYGPAPQSSYESEVSDRAFTRLHVDDTLPYDEIEKKLAREVAFDPDCWIVDVEERSGRHFLDQVV